MTIAVSLILRRAAWMKWLPPMANASPSPIGTMTCRSGRDILMPVAKASALPCSVCMVWKSTYPAMRAEQPMPDTMTRDEGS